MTEGEEAEAKQPIWFQEGAWSSYGWQSQDSGWQDQWRHYANARPSWRHWEESQDWGGSSMGVTVHRGVRPVRDRGGAAAG